MHELDFDPRGFSWIDCADADQSVISFIRRGRSTDRIVLAVFNFAPVPTLQLSVGGSARGLLARGS